MIRSCMKDLQDQARLSAIFSRVRNSGHIPQHRDRLGVKLPIKLSAKTGHIEHLRLGTLCRCSG